VAKRRNALRSLEPVLEGQDRQLGGRHAGATGRHAHAASAASASWVLVASRMLCTDGTRHRTEILMTIDREP